MAKERLAKPRIGAPAPKVSRSKNKAKQKKPELIAPQEALPAIVAEKPKIQEIPLPKTKSTMESLMENPVALGVAVFVGFVLFYWVVSLFWRVSALESKLSQSVERTSQLETQLKQLQQVVQHIPDKLDPSFKIRVGQLLDQWKDQIGEVSAFMEKNSKDEL